MILFKCKSEKAIFNQYYNLYSKWFNRKIPVNTEMSTKALIKLIENEYSSMSEEQIKIESISLKERIEINKIRKKNSVEYCFYKICMDVLNYYIDSKLRKKPIKDGGFLVDLSDWVFGTLEKLSIFNIVRKLKHTTSYKFVDLWIIGNLIAAILSSILVYNLTIENKYLVCIILIYSILRVFEVIIYQINVLLFHPYRAKKEGREYKIKTVTRMVIALLHNYIEIMFWYSTMVISIIIFNGESPYNLTWMEIIKSNILCIATLDGNWVKEAVKSSYNYLSSLVFLEIISGIIMTIISLARFIGALPGVDSEE